MPKPIVISPKQTFPVSENGKNYLQQPPLIGAVLKQKAKALNLKPKQIAPIIKRNWRSIYAIYKRKYLKMPEMIVWSEVLNENLFLLYHPNVEPKPDPRDEEIEKLRGYIKNYEGIEERLDRALTENISLRAKNELLQALLLEKNGK